MKVYPILMSAPMIMATIAGRKSQTRRLCKGGVIAWLEPDMFTPEFVSDPSNNLCPYGTKGDILYVRESWKPLGWSSDDDPELHIQYKADQIAQAFYASEDVCEKIDLSIHAECAKKGVKIDGDGKYLTDDDPISWRPSIHLPKELSRIWLKVSEVRIERLQDVTNQDSLAEGIDFVERRGSAWYKDYLFTHLEGIQDCFNYLLPKNSFRSLWMKIHGRDSWRENPWVWVIEYQVLSITGKDDIPQEILRQLDGKEVVNG